MIFFNFKHHRLQSETENGVSGKLHFVWKYYVDEVCKTARFSPRFPVIKLL